TEGFANPLATPRGAPNHADVSLLRFTRRGGVVRWGLGGLPLRGPRCASLGFHLFLAQLTENGVGDRCEVLVRFDCRDNQARELDELVARGDARVLTDRRRRRFPLGFEPLVFELAELLARGDP